MKRLGLATFAGVLAFAAIGLSQPTAAQAGWGFGFDIFGPSSSFSYQQYAPPVFVAPPIYAPPPVRVYHYPGCFAPPVYAPPCYGPFHHHHHGHYHGW